MIKRIKDFFIIITKLLIFVKNIPLYILKSINVILGTIPSLLKADLIISRKIKEKQIDEISDSGLRIRISTEDLEKELESTLHRLERIEDKAKSTILGLALSISLAAPSILLLVQEDVFADEIPLLKNFSAIILISAIIFLIISGYLSMYGYQAGMIYKPQLQNNNKGANEAKREILNCIELNELVILKRANLLSAGMDCLRNGLVFVLIFIIIAVISSL